MPDLILGSTPPRLTAWLVAAAPFAASVTADAAFPAAPELVFSDGTVWTATLSGDSLTAAWLKTAEEVDAVADSGAQRVTLRDPSTHVVYASGKAYVTQVVGSGAPSSVPAGGALTVDTLDGNLTLTYSTSEVDPAEIEAAVVDYLTANPPAVAVESVNGETGVVVLDAADVGADPAGTAATAVAGVTVASIGAATAAQGAKADTAVQPADLTPYATDADLAAHAADTSAIHGIADTAALVLTSDARLSDSRTPTAHTHDDRYFTETEVTSALAGKAATSHTHAAADVTSGTFPVGRIGSGTPAAGKYVDGGTGAWTALPEGGGGSALGLWFSGASGNYVAAPYVAAFATTDLDVRARIRRAAYNDGEQVVACRYQTATATDQSWYLATFSAGSTNQNLRLLWRDAGGTAVTVTSGNITALTAGTAYWIRATLDVDNGSGGYTASFYYAADSETEPTTWTDWGAPVVGGATSSIQATTAALDVGAARRGALWFTGTIARVILKGSINGATIADWKATVSTRTRDPQGNVWTVTGTTNAFEEM